MADQIARTIMEGLRILFKDVGDGSRALAVSIFGSVSDANGGAAGLIPNGTEEVLAVSNAVDGVSLVGGFPPGTTHICIVADTTGGVNARWSAAPTATRGYSIAPYENHVWRIEMALAAKFIRQTVDTNIVAIPMRVAL